MTGARRFTALFALALGGFALGLTEFVTFGLLPEIAHDVLPGLSATNMDAALGQAGWTVAAYALGVVVGAPTLAILTAHLPTRGLLIGLVVALVIGNALSAIAPTLPLLLAARFVAGLPHGAYFGAAGLLASHMFGPGARARGFAFVLSGLTIANVVGVPVMTWLGQSTSWRVAYTTVAVVFAIAGVLAALTIRDSSSGERSSSARNELSALKSPVVWLAVLVAAIGAAGFFTVDSYIAPIVTGSAHLPASVVPFALSVVGIGMTVGTFAGGAASDRAPNRSLIIGLVAVTLAMVLFALFAHLPVALFVFAFAIGATSVFLAPTLQTQLVHAAPDAVLIGPALNQSALNISNGIGALAGGAVITSGLPYTATGWAGAVFGVVGLALAAVLFRVAARRRVPVHAVAE